MLSSSDLDTSSWVQTETAQMENKTLKTKTYLSQLNTSSTERQLTFAHDSSELARQIPLCDNAYAWLSLSSPTPTQVGAWRSALALRAEQGALQGGLLPTTESLDRRHDHLVELLQWSTQIAALQHILVVINDKRKEKKGKVRRVRGEQVRKILEWGFYLTESIITFWCVKVKDLVWDSQWRSQKENSDINQ